MSLDRPTAKESQKNHGDYAVVTVFTPTFNRKHTLERVYRSLQAQTFRNFEWLIVDDGSTDDTGSLVAGWLREDNFFPVRYYWKANGGKHTAHNYALSLARGEYIAILDSDDWYVPDALKILLNAWEAIPQEQQRFISNVEGLSSYADGRTVGHRFPRDIYDGNHLAMQRTHNFDTRGMYRSDVLRLYPFPDGYEGCFVPESLIWNRIAQKYNTRYINKKIGFTEYQQDGLTNRTSKAFFARSEPLVLFYREMSRIRYFSLLNRLKYRVNIYRYALHNKLPIRNQLKEERLMVWGLPFVALGYCVYLMDREKRLRDEQVISSTNRFI